METYKLPYAKWIASGDLLYDSVTTWWGGVGWEVGGKYSREGAYVHLRLINVNVWQKPTTL